MARERFGADRVFLYPLDFAFAVRAYLQALRPSLLVLMESELWPRMLGECARAGLRGGYAPLPNGRGESVPSQRLE